MDSFFVKFIMWGILTALAYHVVVGIRHLMMDFGYLDETLEAGKRSAKISFVITVVLSLLAGVLVVVSNASALGRNGVHDFILVRATAIVLDPLHHLHGWLLATTGEISVGSVDWILLPPASLKSSLCWLSSPFSSMPGSGCGRC